ncbi:hypothetical protein RSOLAG1IB_06500 [Rhizoctonia solani AG-1 IB]|uniref:Uncharacterized protein n=1 Tax=Thanatephorus cucumeris (strain AG1-IB / isolate 7/3/14) TaxID=1108050 RepID=A0A0B7F7Y0_THACB|nr:hypothetical protein RSOLAG1IB_06500 [Rhizoctonia solani AG-1 IB]
MWMGGIRICIVLVWRMKSRIAIPSGDTQLRCEGLCNRLVYADSSDTRAAGTSQPLYISILGTNPSW